MAVPPKCQRDVAGSVLNYLDHLLKPRRAPVGLKLNLTPELFAEFARRVEEEKGLRLRADQMHLGCLHVSTVATREDGSVLTGLCLSQRQRSSPSSQTKNLLSFSRKTIQRLPKTWSWR